MDFNMDNRKCRILRSRNPLSIGDKILVHIEKTGNRHTLSFYHTNNYDEIASTFTDTLQEEIDITAISSVTKLQFSFENVILYKYDPKEQRILFVVQDDNTNAYKFYTNFYNNVTINENTESDKLFKKVYEINIGEVPEGYSEAVAEIKDVYVNFYSSHSNNEKHDFLFCTYNMSTNNGNEYIVPIKAFGSTNYGDVGVTKNSDGPTAVPLEKALTIVLKSDIDYSIYDKIEDIDLTTAVPWLEEKLHISDDDINDMVSNILTVIGGLRSTDASKLNSTLLKDKIAADGSVKRAYYNNSGMSGTFSTTDGNTVSILEQDRNYIMLHTSLSLVKPEIYFEDYARMRKTNLVTNLNQIQACRPFFHIFVNGRKVIDGEIYLYIQDDSTDIFIPETFLYTDKTKLNEISIELKYDFNFIYYSQYFVEKLTTDKLVLSVDSIVYADKISYASKIKNMFKKCTNENAAKSILCYIDGYYYPDAHITYNTNDNNLEVYIDNHDLASLNIEIVVDSSIAAKHRTIDKKSHDFNERYYIIPEEKYLDVLTGPISKDACYFYKKDDNGKYLKVANDNIIQLTRNIFEEPLTTAVNFEKVDTYTLVSDTGYMINDTLTKIYAEDYYLLNLFGTEGLAELLYNTEFEADEEETIRRAKRREILEKDFPGQNYASFKYSLNRLSSDSELNKRYSVENLHIIRNLVKWCNNKYAVALELLKFRPYLIRGLLQKHKMPKANKKFEGIPSDKIFDITLGIKKPDDITLSNFYSVFINGYYIPKKCYKIIDMHKCEVIAVDADKVIAYKENIVNKNGTNYVSLTHSLVETSKIESITIKPKNVYLNSDTNTYQCLIPTMRSIKDKSDYIMLEETRDDPSVLYIEGSNNTGWKLFTRNVDYTINKSNEITADGLDIGLTKIDFGAQKPRKNLLLYSKRFKFAFSHKFDKEMTSLSDLIIPIRVNTSSLPILPTFGYKVFLNGQMLVEDRDYMFRSPSNNDFIAYSAIILKKRIKKYDLLTVVFNNIKSKVITNFKGEQLDDYGLLYLGELDCPYDPQYVDIYLNGKFILPQEIDILSDKLIRIPKELQPFRDVYVETRFKEDYSLYEEILNLYSKYTGSLYSPYEIFVKKWFNFFDLSIPIKEKQKDKLLQTGLFKSSYEINKLYNVLDYNHLKENKTLYINNPSIPTIKNKGISIIKDNKGVIFKPNPIRSANDIYTNNLTIDPLINAYVFWLRSNNVGTYFQPDKILKPEVSKYFSIFMEKGQKGIVIDPTRYCLYKDITLGHRNYMPVTDMDITPGFESIKFILRWAYSKGIVLNDPNMIKNAYLQTKYIQNIIYPKDIPKAISGLNIVNIPKDKAIVVGGRPQKNKGFVKDLITN